MSLSKLAAAEEDSEFVYLPIEIKDKIFRLLDLDGKKTTRLICNDWYFLANTLLQFKAELTNESLKEIQQTKMEISNLTVRNFNKPTQLFNIKSKRGAVWFKNINKVKIKERVSKDNLIKIFNNIQRVISLGIYNKSLGSIKSSGVIIGLRLELLMRFIIQIEDYDVNHQKAINQVLKTIQLPKLFTLRVLFENKSSDPYIHVAYPYKKYQEIITNVYEFIAKHYKTLKCLEIVEEISFSDLGNGFVFDPLNIQLSEQSIENLKKLELRNLETVRYPEYTETWPLIWMTENSHLVVYVEMLVILALHHDNVTALFNNIRRNITALSILEWNTYRIPDALRVELDVLISASIQLTDLIIMFPIYNFTFIPSTVEEIYADLFQTSVGDYLTILGQMPKLKSFTIITRYSNFMDPRVIEKFNILLNIPTIRKIAFFETKFNKRDIANYCEQFDGITFYPNVHEAYLEIDRKVFRGTAPNP